MACVSSDKLPVRCEEFSASVSKEEAEHEVAAASEQAAPHELMSTVRRVTLLKRGADPSTTSKL
eukprot:6188092-Pleurochrysis_carterae.AAC.4